MYEFKNDYSEGCHPSILRALSQANLAQEEGYGEDTYSQQAKELIKSKLQAPASTVHFVSGGTQANLCVIAAALKPHESIISANTGHINLHEAGAIEATGHKVNELVSRDGKLRVCDIEQVLAEHQVVPHMVKPRMVYLSNSTELGTIYLKEELAAISACCKQHNLLLYVDGARIGAALSAPSNNLSLADMAQLTDVFYIGGTKNGAWLGEAIVIQNPSIQHEFEFHLKQRGALLSKGRLLGIQFLALFQDDLLFDLAKHANAMAAKLADAFLAAGCQMLTKPYTNQIFPVLPNQTIACLAQNYGFYTWQAIDEEQSAIRMVTSWATQVEKVDAFIHDLHQALQL